VTSVSKEAKQMTRDDIQKMAVESQNKHNIAARTFTYRLGYTHAAIEIRNQTVDEVIERLNSPLLNFSDGLIYKGTVIEILNSLKLTK
jgi:hypothetical protein